MGDHHRARLAAAALRPPEPPLDPLEFLSRSWSASAVDVPRARGLPPPLPSPTPPPALVGPIAEEAACELDDGGGGGFNSSAAGSASAGSSFSFASAATSQLIMERILAQSVQVEKVEEADAAEVALCGTLRRRQLTDEEIAQDFWESMGFPTPASRFWERQSFLGNEEVPETPPSTTVIASTPTSSISTSNQVIYLCTQWLRTWAFLHKPEHHLIFTVACKHLEQVVREFFTQHG